MDEDAILNKSRFHFYGKNYTYDCLYVSKGPKGKQRLVCGDKDKYESFDPSYVVDFPRIKLSSSPFDLEITAVINAKNKEGYKEVSGTKYIATCELSN